jgi:hypothetical protein
MHVYVDANSKVGKVILALGVPLFSAFLGMQFLSFHRSLRSLSWPATDGVITVSKKDKVMTQHGAHDRPEIKYTYQVGGVSLENDTIEFGCFRGILTWGYTARQLSDFPAGRPVPVYHDPARPSVSCLRRGGIGWEDIAMFPVCVTGLVMGVKQVRTFLSGRSNESQADGGGARLVRR